MSSFRYEAVDEIGTPRSGTLAVATLREAVEELKARGWHVRRLERTTDGDGGGLGGAGQGEEPPPRVSEATAAETAGLLSEAITAGLPLEPALRAAAADARWGEARVLHRVADLIAAGTPPDEAFARAGDALPSHLLAVIVAGLRSGRLGTLLGRYLTVSRQRAELRRPLLLALVYPAMLAFGTAAVIVIGLLVLVPMFEQIFNDFGSRLPFVTQAVIEVSRFLRSFGGLALIGLAAVVVTFAVAWLVARRGHGLSGVPPFEILLRPADWARFCGLLALLIDSRLPLPQAIRLTAVAASTRRVRRVGLGLADDIEQGMTLADASRTRPVPPAIRHAFRWSDRPDLLSEALAGLAELSSRRNRIAAAVAALVIEPFVLAASATALGLFFGSLFAPLISLLNDLS